MSDDATPFRRMLSAIPAKEPDPIEDADAAISAEVKARAQRRSEARRDAFIAVALAVVRRGQNPAKDLTTDDSNTVDAIADMLIALE